MNRRLYFLMPSVQMTKVVVDELLLARVDARHVHVLAGPGAPLGDLPEATLFQRSDFIPAVEHGVAIGGLTGIVAGVAALSVSGLALAGGALLAMAVAGAVVGAWISGMIGLDVRSSRLRDFEESIRAGKVLMMVDVPRSRVDEIGDLVRRHHPEADLRGQEPTIPAFP